MGLLKRIKIKDYEIVIKTLSMLSFMRLSSELQGTSMKAIKILEYSIEKEDMDYLNNMDFENNEEQKVLMNALFQAIIEVNPRLFPKPQIVETPVSTSGPPSNSDGNPTK